MSWGSLRNLRRLALRKLPPGLILPPPVITSAALTSFPEESPLAHTLTANEPVTWSIVGGLDASELEIASGNVLRFVGNVSKSFEAPDDSNADRSYVVVVRATSVATGRTADQTITLTLTNVIERTSFDMNFAANTYSTSQGESSLIALLSTELSRDSAGLKNLTGSMIYSDFTDLTDDVAIYVGKTYIIDATLVDATSLVELGLYQAANTSRYIGASASSTAIATVAGDVTYGETTVPTTLARKIAINLTQTGVSISANGSAVRTISGNAAAHALDTLYIGLKGATVARVQALTLQDVADLPALSTPTPAPSSYTLNFGQLTPSGAGAWKPVAITAASTSLTGTNASHFAMSAGGVLTPTAAFVASPQPTYTLGATIDGQAVTLNITTTADAYTVSSDAEADALNWAGMSGKTVKFRGPLLGGPTQYMWVRPGQSYCGVPYFNSRSWAATVTCDAADPADKPLMQTADGGAGVRWSMYLIQVNKLRWTNLRLYGPWFDTDDAQMGNNSGVAVASGSVTQPMIWLRNTVGDFEVDHCELFGNLSSFAMNPRRLVWYGALGYNSGSTVTGHLNLHDNVLHDCRRLLTIPEGTDTGFITIEKNEFHNFGGDGITFTKLKNATVRWNYFHSPYTYKDDPGHGDFIQSIYNGTDVLTNVAIYGNVFNCYRHDGLEAKTEFQGVYLDDIAAPGYFSGFKIYNNLMITSMTHGMIMNRSKNCFWWRNTLVRDVDNLEAVGVGSPWIYDWTTGEDNLASNNIASSISITGPRSIKLNNIETMSSEVSYDANFDGASGVWRPTSLAQALAMFSPKAGGPAAVGGIGALGSYFDFIARTVDTTGAPWLDATAPTLTSASGSPTNSNSAIVSVSTNEGLGSIPWYISTSAVAPSAADLKAGTGATTYGAIVLTGTSGVKSATASGLSPSTPYYVYFLHRDWMGNESAIVSDDFTTPAMALDEAVLGSKTYYFNAAATQTISLADLKDKDNNNVVLAEGDYIVINANYCSTGSVAGASKAIAGYTLATAGTFANGTRDTNQWVQFKKMGATPDATVALPSASANTGAAVTIHALRGVDLTTLLDVTPTVATGTGGTNANPPAITPGSPQAIIMICGASTASNGNAGSMAQPSGTSNVTNHFRAVKEPNAGFAQARVATAFYFDWAGGAYDPAQFTDATGDAAGTWSAVTLALRRAA